MSFGTNGSDRALDIAPCYPELLEAAFAEEKVFTDRSTAANVARWLARQEGPTRARIADLLAGAIPALDAPDDDGARKLPAPLGIADLLAVEEPEEEWLAEGLLPAGGNILWAGYPKTYKTMVLLELLVSLASGTRFMGRFDSPVRRRVGGVLMEDQAHRVRYRINRLCAARGIDPADLDGWLYLWFRPPLRLTDHTVTELGQYAAELDLDYLHVDSWSYVASGDSNSSDDVTPQLQSFSLCRVDRPGLTVGLTHHARKDKGDGADGSRLTDIIRNSSAFGAWYDAGLVLSRRDETSPVTVRAELRDYVSPEPFAFTVADQYPAGPENNFRSGGWLKIEAQDETPQAIERRHAAEKLAPTVRDFLSANPGVSKRRLRDGIEARAADVEAAFDHLVQLGAAEYRAPEKRGKAGECHLLDPTVSDRVPTVSGTHSGGPCPTVSRPPKGGGPGHTPTPSDAGDRVPKLCPDCGTPIGVTADRCAPCKYGRKEDVA